MTKHSRNPSIANARKRDRSREPSVNSVGFGRSQSMRDQEQMERQQRYKEELDRQMIDLERKRNAEKEKQLEEERKLEMKVKRDREQLAKQQQKEGGIFGKDMEREKVDRARKQEQFQEELRRQSEERKRKKEEEKRKEKERERKLEEKIQREMRELQNRHQIEKQREQTLGEMPLNGGNAGGAGSVPNEPGIQLFVSKKPRKPIPETNIEPMVTAVTAPSIPTAVVSAPPVPTVVHHQPAISKPVPMIMQHPVETVPNLVNVRNIRPSSGRRMDDNRPSTSKKMIQEILALKQDLLQNQKMIRDELAVHKQQVLFHDPSCSKCLIWIHFVKMLLIFSDLLPCCTLSSN